MANIWSIGDRVGDGWEIYNIIEGGIGQVYIIYDHVLESVFAAKSYPEKVFRRNPHIADRFNKEAGIWINLDRHENITQAHMITNVRGRPFLLLEYVSGGDLSRWIGTPRLVQDLATALLFSIHFCDGMTHALAKGIKAHRDIKPANCLITVDKTLKITDFGLATIFKDMDKDSYDSMSRVENNISGCDSRTGILKGTPCYMAPEQFDDAKHVDVRSDIYSFGIMFFEMLTGNLPFQGQSVNELEKLHKRSPLPKLKIKERRLRDIVNICLEKDPSNRFENFKEIRAAMEDVYKRLTGMYAQKPFNEKALNWIEYGNKAISFYSLGLYDEALKYFDMVLKKINFEPSTILYKAHTLCQISKFESAIDYYNEFLKYDSKHAEAIAGKARTLGALKHYAEAVEYFDQAIALDPNNVTIWNNRGLIFAEMDKISEALTCFEKALELDPRNAEPYSNKALCLMKLSRIEDALECCDQAIQLNPRYEKAWMNRGLALALLGRVEDELECYNLALRFLPRSKHALNNKGAVLAQLGKYDEALEYCELALKIDAHHGSFWISKGRILGELKRFHEALECFSKAQECDPHLAAAPYYKSAIFFMQGHMEEGKHNLELAAILGDEHSKQFLAQYYGYDASAWNNRGAELAGEEKWQEAIKCYELAIDLDPKLLEAWQNKGIALDVLEHYEKAIDCYNRTIEIKSDYFLPWLAKGMTLAICGKYDEAIECLKEAQRLGCAEADQWLVKVQMLKEVPEENNGGDIDK